MNDITRLKLHTYLLGIAMLVIGTFLAGLINGSILNALSDLGISLDEQLPWLNYMLMWISFIVIVCGTTAFMNDMTSEIGESNLRFLMLWPLTIAVITMTGNLIMGASAFDMTDVIIVSISLLTIAAIKQKDILNLIK